MSRPVTWFRLYRGRVWHVRAGAIGSLVERALCGAEPYSGEELEDRPPWGGKPCPECVSVARRMVEAGIEAGAAWSARQYSAEDLVHAEIVEVEPWDHLCGSLECDHSCSSEAEHQCGPGCPCGAAEAEARAINAAEAAPAERVAQPVDLVAVLRASVEAAKARSEAAEVE